MFIFTRQGCRATCRGELINFFFSFLNEIHCTLRSTSARAEFSERIKSVVFAMSYAASELGIKIATRYLLGAALCKYCVYFQRILTLSNSVNQFYLRRILFAMYIRIGGYFILAIRATLHKRVHFHVYIHIKFKDTSRL